MKFATPRLRSLCCVATLSWLISGIAPVEAGEFESRNFRVKASSEELAKAVGEVAEERRSSLARAWFGKELAAWKTPCRITVKTGDRDPRGSTVYSFTEQGDIYDARMTVDGTADDILASVLPHEVSHAVFASYFREPLPRWADEGMATLAECESARTRQKLQAGELMRDEQRIPLRSLLRMDEYPDDELQAVILYTQGYTISEFLVEQGRRGKFVSMLDAARDGGWETALRHVYKFESIDNFEERWQAWLAADLKSLESLPLDTAVASEPAASAAKVLRVSTSQP